LALRPLLLAISIALTLAAASAAASKLLALFKEVPLKSKQRNCLHKYIKARTYTQCDKNTYNNLNKEN